MSIVVHSTVERQSVGRSVVAVAGLAGAVCRIVALGVLVLAGLAAIGGILVLILILVLIGGVLLFLLFALCLGVGLLLGAD